MTIPTEYYEEEFIDFENYLNVTGDIKKGSKENIHANCEYQLEKYKTYEKFLKNESRIALRKKSQSKKKSITSQSNVVKEEVTRNAVSSCSKAHSDRDGKVKFRLLFNLSSC